MLKIYTLRNKWVFGRFTKDLKIRWSFGKRLKPKEGPKVSFEKSGSLRKKWRKSYPPKLAFLLGSYDQLASLITFPCSVWRYRPPLDIPIHCLEPIHCLGLLFSIGMPSQGRCSSAFSPHFAFLLSSQMPKELFSVSKQMAKYPISGMAVLGKIIFPPSFSISAVYLSTEGTST